MQIKSKKRVTNHGEVFTAEREVNAMLDLVKQETDRIDSRFLEPACGNGNFLAEILRRKFTIVKFRYGKNAADYERYSVVAISSIYGIDILQDNVIECRDRMYAIFEKEYMLNCQEEANDETRESVRCILQRNILCGDAQKMKTLNGEPIIFSEWSIIKECFIKRRDFQLDQISKYQLDFSNVGRCQIDETGVMVQCPIREFPPIHYRKIPQYE